MKTRAFLYARMGVADSGAAGQPLAQLDACRAYATAHGYRVVAESTDFGSGLVMERPGIDSMLALARKGAIDVVVTRDVDRLTRNTLAAQRLMAELAAVGVRVETVTAPAAGMAPSAVMEAVAAPHSAVGAAP